MRAGRLDTRIKILQRVETRDPDYNTAENNWIVFAERWAQVSDMLPSRAERVQEGINLSRRPARIRLRWLAGVTAEMSVQIGLRILQIVSGPAMIGRREIIEIVAEEISSFGEEP